jgi:2-haloacid dehalogenase
MSSIPQLLIFDVNETLLDTAAVANAINEALGDAEAANSWFRALLHYSLVETVSGGNSDFSEIADACLEMTAKKYDETLSPEERRKILYKFRQLSAFKEVSEALDRLKNAGFSMVALSNGTLEAINEQLDFAGINQFFDRTFSIQRVGRFKPHPATYAHVLDSMEIAADKAMMVAVHPWDVLGASREGLQTAFISRPGKVNYPLAPAYDYNADDLMLLADQLIPG